MVKLSRKYFSDFWVSGHEKLSDFYASSWQRGDSAVPLLVLRIVLAALAVGILMWATLRSPTPYWLIYLTNWGLVLVTAMTLNGALVSIMAARKRLPESSDETLSLPWYVSMYWFLFNVTVSVSLLITVLYWILLFTPEMKEDIATFWLDVSTHGLNSVIVMIEVLTSRMPVYLQHFYQPLGVGIWYAAFSAIYYLTGGTDSVGNPYIYDVLNWEYPTQAGSIIGISVAGIIVIYITIFSLTWVREKTSTSLIRTTSHNLPYTADPRNTVTV